MNPKTPFLKKRAGSYALSGPFLLLRLIERNFPMARKPTYEELRKRVKDLEKELVKCRQAENALRASNSLGFAH